METGSEARGLDQSQTRLFLTLPFNLKSFEFCHVVKYIFPLCFLTSFQVVQGDLAQVQRGSDPDLEGALGDGIPPKLHHNRHLALQTRARHVSTVTPLQKYVVR